MTIKEQYNRAYRNYLRRVNRAVKQGYIPQVRKRVKTPKKESIKALEKLTGEYIRSHSPIHDIKTGQEKIVKNKKQRLAIQKRNVNILSAPLQSVDNVVNVGQPIQDIQMSSAVLSYNDSYEQIIANWYEQIHTNFYWYIGQFVEWQTNRLIEGKDDETRKRFAYVLTQNPDIFPEAPYATREEITTSFNDISRMMDLAPDSEAYKDFLSMYDIVESEDV